MLDRKGKLFGKISFVDLFVVILVIGIALGTIYKFQSPVTNVSAGDSELNYTVKISDVRSFSADYYKEGLNVYDSKSGANIGKIKSVQINPFVSTLAKTDGTVVSSEVPGKVQIFLGITTMGLETDQSFLANGTYPLNVGSGIYIKTKYTDVNGVVDSISRVQ